MPNFKPKMLFANPNESGLNGLVFATYAEAMDNARDLFGRWTLPTGFDVVETEDPVNYTYIDHKLVAVTPTQEN